MIKVPPRYKIIKENASTVAVKKEYEGPLMRLGISQPERLLKKYISAHDTSKGRGPVLSVPIGEMPGTRIMIRKYLRGGLVRFVNNDTFLGNQRPFNELNIGAEAYARNIPTAETLAAVSIRKAGPFYKGYLITKELNSCSDLPQYLKELSKSSSADFSEKKEQVLVKTAETVRIMHDKGFLHADLNMKNILINSLTPENIFIIDWDKSVLKNNLTEQERSSNIIRFCRSMQKLKQQGIPVTENDQELFLNNYWENPKKASTDLLKLKQTVRRRKLIWKILEKN
jgi:tRNA A-37 threonylcarbamoyl transferase component Bud32